MHNHHLHVALASDSNYAEFVAVVIVSLFDTNHWQDYTTIHLLSNGVDDATLQKLAHHIPVGKGELKVYDIKSLKEDLGIDVPSTIAITSYARLFLPDLLSSEVKRVLYLDCDIAVSGSVEELYCVDFNDNWIAGVRDTLNSAYTKTSVGMEITDEYFNAGVLMMNLTAWREHHVTRLCLHFLLSHGGKVVHHDQGIINGVCNHHKLVVHPRFNVTTSYFSHPYWLLKKKNTPFYDQRQVREAIDFPAIIHYTEGFLNRPWVHGCVHPLRGVFTDYRSLTNWSQYPLLPDKRSRVNKIQAWFFIHMPYFMFLLVNRLISLSHKIKSILIGPKS